MNLGIRSIAFTVAAFSLAGPLQAQDPAVTFTDVTDEAGVGYVQHTFNDVGACLLGPENDDCEQERMTGGAAVGDYNQDGWEDLFVTRLEGADILFENQGDGTFADVTAAVGLDVDAPTNGALWVDIDNDGDLDLVVTSMGGFRNYLYVNNGGTFTEEAEARGLAQKDGHPHAGWSIAAGDYDGDGWYDLFTVEWRAGGLDTGPDTHGHGALFQNRGPANPGHFIDRTEEANVDISPSRDLPDGLQLGFAPAFVDLDRDGALDLTVVSDFGTSVLLWNEGDGSFKNGTAAASVGTDEFGMGSTFGDYDMDGDLDWFVTSISVPASDCSGALCTQATGNRLYRYAGQRRFVDATDTAGVRDGHWGWGTVFFDADNDGDLDLVMTNGMSLPSKPDHLEPFDDDPMRFWVNENGEMIQAAAAVGLTDTRMGKGLLTFDYDRDGDLDLFVVNNGAEPVLYRNDGGNDQDWLRIRFEGPARAFAGLNAFVTLFAEEGASPQVREIGVASHFLGQSERVAHFGLGDWGSAPVHRVKVEWPRTGIVQTFDDVGVNQEHVIVAPPREVVNSDGSCVRGPTYHAADINGPDGRIDLSELLRVIQLYRFESYHTDADSEDGYAPGKGDRTGPPHSADFELPHWELRLKELLRLVQLFNSRAYHDACFTEDGFAPGETPK